MPRRTKLPPAPAHWAVGSAPFSRCPAHLPAGHRHSGIVPGAAELMFHKPPNVRPPCNRKERGDNRLHSIRLIEPYHGAGTWRAPGVFGARTDSGSKLSATVLDNGLRPFFV